MKKLLLLILFFPTISQAAAAHVQTPANGGNCTATTCAQPAFSPNVTAGNMILFGCMIGAIGRTITGSDTLTNTFVTDKVQAETVDGGDMAAGHAYNIAGGADTFSCNISGGSATIRVSASEFSGAATTAALDKSASAQGSSAAPASGAVVPTVDGEVLYVVTRTANNRTYTAGVDYARVSQVPSNGPNTRMASEYYIQPTAASHDGTFSLSTTDTWATVILTFKPPAAVVAVVATPPTLNLGLGQLILGNGGLILR